MRAYHPGQAAAAAVAARPDRPATAMVHDSHDARLVVFRIEPGQQVVPHTSHSTVFLSVVEGTGVLSGADAEREVRAGDLVAYEPGEVHSMRAADEQLVLLAIIAPRPQG